MSTTANLMSHILGIHLAAFLYTLGYTARVCLYCLHFSVFSEQFTTSSCSSNYAAIMVMGNLWDENEWQ